MTSNGNLDMEDHMDLANAEVTSQKWVFLQEWNVFVVFGEHTPDDKKRNLTDILSKLAKSEDGRTDVCILLGGNSNILEEVIKLLQSDTSVLIVLGTGGYADVLTKFLVLSEQIGVEEDTSWNDMVNGYVVSGQTREAIQAVENDGATDIDKYRRIERNLVQCLQKRELLSVLQIPSPQQQIQQRESSPNNNRNSNLVILEDALVKARFKREIGRNKDVLNYHLLQNPEILKRFFVEAMMCDNARYVQRLMETQEENLAKHEDWIKQKLWGDNWNQYKKTFNEMMYMWAVSHFKQDCALLWWRKGKNLLKSALNGMIICVKKECENAEEAKLMKSQLEDTAKALVNECYNQDKAGTLRLLERQFPSDDIHTIDTMLDLEASFLGTEALKKYFDQIWRGKVKTCFASGCIADRYPKICDTFSSPRTLFFLDLITYLLFLCVFGFTLVFELNPVFSPWEGVVFIWVIGIAIEEIWQCCRTTIIVKPTEKHGKCKQFWLTAWEKVKGYLRSYWNILDSICILLFFLGAMLMIDVHVNVRVLNSNSTQVTGNQTGSVSAVKQFYLERNDQYVYEAARILLTLSMMAFIIRILHYCAISQFLGATLEMIWHMTLDLRRYLIVIVIFMVAFGIGTVALTYPNAKMELEMVTVITKRTYWSLFGEFYLDELDDDKALGECGSYINTIGNTPEQCKDVLRTRTFLFIFLSFYVLLMNLFFLNIIIASFNNTFLMISDQSKVISHRHYAKVVMEYLDSSPVPPPINIIYLPLHLHQLYTRKKRQRNTPSEQQRYQSVYSEEKEKETKESCQWEKSMLEYVLAKRKNAKYCTCY